MVSEYLKGGVTFRELEEKYGTSSSTIHRWVKEAEAGMLPWRKVDRESRQEQETKELEASSEVKRLRQELEQERLYNQLLNAMIDIAEEELKIPIRKKSGAKR